MGNLQKQMFRRKIDIIRELKKFGIKYKKEVKEELIKESTENYCFGI